MADISSSKVLKQILKTGVYKSIFGKEVYNVFDLLEYYNRMDIKGVQSLSELKMLENQYLLATHKYTMQLKNNVYETPLDINPVRKDMLNIVDCYKYFMRNSSNKIEADNLATGVEVMYITFLETLNFKLNITPENRVNIVSFGNNGELSEEDFWSMMFNTDLKNDPLLAPPFISDIFMDVPPTDKMMGVVMPLVYSGKIDNCDFLVDVVKYYGKNKKGDLKLNASLIASLPNSIRCNPDFMDACISTFGQIAVQNVFGELYNNKNIDNHTANIANHKLSENIKQVNTNKLNNDPKLTAKVNTLIANMKQDPIGAINELNKLGFNGWDVMPDGLIVDKEVYDKAQTLTNYFNQFKNRNITDYTLLPKELLLNETYCKTIEHTIRAALTKDMKNFDSELAYRFHYNKTLEKYWGYVEVVQNTEGSKEKQKDTFENVTNKPKKETSNHGTGGSKFSPSISLEGTEIHNI